MGYDVGDTIDKIFLGGEKNSLSNGKKLSKYDVEQFLIGVLEGIVEDIPDIGPCIEDSGFDIEDVI